MAAVDLLWADCFVISRAGLTNEEDTTVNRRKKLKIANVLNYRLMNCSDLTAAEEVAG